jgi:hypothetical protein
MWRRSPRGVPSVLPGPHPPRTQGRAPLDILRVGADGLGRPLLGRRWRLHLSIMGLNRPTSNCPRSPGRSVGDSPDRQPLKRRVNKRCAHRVDGSPGSERQRFRRSEKLCGQGQDRTVDLPLFRGSIAPCVTRDRDRASPVLPAYWLVRANKSILAAVPPCAGEYRIVCGYLVGITPANPDLWGFCGGAGDVLAAGLPASGMINGSTPRAAQPSRSVPAWLAPLGVETHRPADSGWPILAGSCGATERRSSIPSRS